MKQNVSSDREWLKWLTYAAMTLVAYLLQGLTVFPEIFGVTPNFMLIIPLCIAVFEGPFGGGLAGAVCGTLFDTLHSFSAGLIPLILLALCALVGLSCQKIFRKTLASTLVLGTLCVLITKLLEWFFFFYFFTADRSLYSLTAHTLPGWIYTSVMLAPVYYLTVWLKSKFDKVGE